MAFYLKNLFLFGLLILVLSSCFSHKWEQKTWTEELFDNVKEANESEYLFRNEKQKLGSIEKEDYPPLGKFVDSWTYYDENDKYVKVYDETGQNERYLEYYRVENAPLPIHSKYYSPY